MDNYNMNHFDKAKTSRYDASIDMGLRSYMINVYNLMGIGLAFTALTAYLVSVMATSTEPTGASTVVLKNGLYLSHLGQLLYTSPLSYVIMFAPLIAVFFISFKINKLPVSTARTLFIAYAGLMGLSLSSIFLVYTSTSITQTFFITAASFGCLSLYGYVTKRDLRPIGNFLSMMVFGLLIASLVNIFMKSSGLQYIISIFGVFIFAGLTAYDTQKIKEMYLESDCEQTISRKAIMGALTLYLDFINMFVFLLQFLNSNRE